MPNDQAELLLQKYASGNCTAEEKALVEKWLFSLHNEPVNITEKRLEEIEAEVLSRLPQAPVKIRPWWKTVAAAALLAGVSFGVFFYLQNRPGVQPVVQSQADIRPGGNKAVLTVAGGHQIILDDLPNGTVSRQGSVTINKTSGGQLVYAGSQSSNTNIVNNTLSTPRGGQFSITLSDGTVAWLNAASSITYPSQFTGAIRQVSITGEVYFEVAHGSQQPFIVKAGQQDIQVLGTRFNVNAYTDEPVLRTTLLEGSVRVIAGTTAKTIHPGEQTVLTGHLLTVTTADTDEAIAWKNGIFQFDGEELESIMRKISRWYNVDVRYEDERTKHTPLTGIITHFSSVSKVLRMLELTKQVHFKIEGDTIVVMK